MGAKRYWRHVICFCYDPPESLLPQVSSCPVTLGTMEGDKFSQDAEESLVVWSRHGGVGVPAIETGSGPAGEAVGRAALRGLTSRGEQAELWRAGYGAQGCSSQRRRRASAHSAGAEPPLTAPPPSWTERRAPRRCARPQAEGPGPPFWARSSGLSDWVQGFCVQQPVSQWHQRKHKGMTKKVRLCYPDSIFISWELWMGFVRDGLVQQEHRFSGTGRGINVGAWGQNSGPVPPAVPTYTLQDVTLWKRRIFSLHCPTGFLTFNQISGSAVDRSGQNTNCPQGFQALFSQNPAVNKCDF